MPSEPARPVDRSAEAPLVIRAAGPADRDACRQVFAIARAATFTWLPPARRDLDFAASTAGEELWVAVAAGTVVALASLYRPSRFLHHLYVLPEWQGRGIGRRLLDRIVAELGGSAALKCDSRNLPARGFYRHLGWRHAADGDDGPDGPYILFETGEGMPRAAARGGGR